MTLVIARRLNDKISLSSDSRISFGGGVVFDRGIKIFKVPVRIRGPLSSIEDRNKWEFEYNYGIAIMGSTLGAYTIKESLSAIISGIQYATNISDISMIGIGQYVYNQFSEISSELSYASGQGGLSEIVFAGWCIIQKRVRVLRFYPVIETTDVKYKAEEILLEDGWFFGGSGKAAAEKVHEANPEFSPLRIIDTVIDNKLDPTVGGPLQVGGFATENFHLTGVRKTVQLADGTMQVNRQFNGFNLDQPTALKQYPHLYIPNGTIDIDHHWPGSNFEYK